MAKELIQPKTVYKATTYSHAVKRSNIVFISGQVAKDVEGKIVGKGDIGAQVEQVFRFPRIQWRAPGAAPTSQISIPSCIRLNFSSSSSNYIFRKSSLQVQWN